MGISWLCTASWQPHWSPYRGWLLASSGLWSATYSLAVQSTPKTAHHETLSITTWQSKPRPDPAWPGSKTHLPSPQMALYFCSGTLRDQAQFRHYALNVPLYTHFTSPIRRFADVLVHRLLAATLGKTALG